MTFWEIIQPFFEGVMLAGGGILIFLFLKGLNNIKENGKR